MLVKEFKCIFSDKRFIIMVAIILIIGTVGVAFSVGSNKEPMIKFGIADMDNSEYSQLLVAYFDENKDFTSYIQIVRGTPEELVSKFQSNELDVYMIIPEGFANSLIVIENRPLKVVINNSDKTKAVLVTNLMSAYADYVTGVQMNCQALIDVMREEGFSSDLVSSVNTEISLDLVFVALDKSLYFERSEIDRFKSISLVNYYLYSAIVLVILYAGMFAGMSALKERLSKAGERLKSVGISAFRIVSSKVLAYSIVYSIMMLLVMVIMKVFGDIEIPFKTMLTVIPIVIGSVLIFLCLARFIKSINSFIVVGNMIILLMTIAGGGIIPIMYLPEACIRIASFTPTYWFIRIICASL